MKYVTCLQFSLFGRRHQTGDKSVPRWKTKCKITDPSGQCVNTETATSQLFTHNSNREEGLDHLTRALQKLPTSERCRTSVHGVPVPGMCLLGEVPTLTQGTLKLDRGLHWKIGHRNINVVLYINFSSVSVPEVFKMTNSSASRAKIRQMTFSVSKCNAPRIASQVPVLSNSNWLYIKCNGKMLCRHYRYISSRDIDN